MATRTTVQITMPAMGESVTDGTVLEWRKQVGDRVELDEPLVEVSTDKVDAELPSPVAGVVEELLAQPDDTVTVGQVVARIREVKGAKPAAKPEPQAPKAEGQEPKADLTNGDANATPVAVRVAAELGIDVSSIQGSGPRGRVTKDDVLAHAEGNGGAPPPAAAAPPPPPPVAEDKPPRGPAA